MAGFAWGQETADSGALSKEEEAAVAAILAAQATPTTPETEPANEGTEEEEEENAPVEKLKCLTV
ncbi:MAG: hypothetical protein IKA93_02800, partial [Elusimicrobiaceae bacterium]|nr:hypothetical protein [Elusimicrobiaceae bacterium]